MNDRGIIYLIQPAELIGTNRYKIGMSKSPTLDRVRTYKKGTRYLCIMEVEKSSEVELEVKNQFKQQFKLVAGYEYFEGQEKYLIDYFLEIVAEFKYSSCPCCDDTGIFPQDGSYCLRCNLGHLMQKTEDQTAEKIITNIRDRQMKSDDKPLCIFCKDTGHHKNELGNYCYTCLPNGDYCPAGQILIKEMDRLELEKNKKKDDLIFESGKHAGKCFKEVRESFPEYFLYLVSQPAGTVFHYFDYIKYCMDYITN